MKKTVLLAAACMMAGISGAYADDRLVMHAKDGTETSVLAQNLRINVKGENLEVSHSGGTSSFAIPELATMEFIIDSAGIENILPSDSGEIDIYTLQGQYVGRFKSPESAKEHMGESGIYVVVAEKGTLKIFIDK